jgi:hypothetical protein
VENGCEYVSVVVHVPKHHFKEKCDGLKEWSHLCILKLIVDVCELSASYFVSFITYKRAPITYFVRILVLLQSSQDMVKRRNLAPPGSVTS